MAGVKGRSGRRPLPVELQKHRAELQKHRTILKSWQVSENALNNPDVELSDKLKIAVPIVTRDITQKVKGEGFSHTFIVSFQDALRRANAGDGIGTRPEVSSRGSEDMAREPDTIR